MENGRELSIDIRQKLLSFKRTILTTFSKSAWLELGVLTSCTQLIEKHSRLLSSLYFGDDDYEKCVIDVLTQIVLRDLDNVEIIEGYLKDQQCFENKDESKDMLSFLQYKPEVFQIPSTPQNPNLVALMMPFGGEFDNVTQAIKEVVGELGLECKRADDIWEHATIIQDIFSLIYQSSIVICDFTGRNPNVFYEAGIAHTLGRTVIPLVQNMADIPFDIRHHRHINYLPNAQGLEKLKADLREKLIREKERLLTTIF